MNLSNKTQEYVRMPSSLTEENGAKAAMMGEFFVDNYLYCEECLGEDDDCEYCGGKGEVIQKVNIPWIVIKEIYSKAVQLFGK